MANKVTIDVEARFVDNVTNNAKRASKAFDEVEKSAREAAKEIDAVGKKPVKPKVDADTSKIDAKLKSTDDKLRKLGRSKTEAKLSFRDKATAVIEKVISKAKSFNGKAYSALVKIRDSNVLSTLNKMSSGLKGITSKVWSAVVKIKDTFTAPLTKLKNMLFNVKTLIAGIASAWAATKLVLGPINLADAYSSAKIGFSTLLGETAGQQMMDDLDEFAKVTPFKTSGVIANAQKMMAMGWDPETIIDDLEIIGNAAAATGKLDTGLESIVRALSQIKTKGKLSTEELNQLAEAGIAAKAMLAEGLGYGTGDEGIAAMTADLESGAIASNEAIAALLEGMKRYDGMMESMANETVEGLWSQIQDVFEINVFRKWGQGLQDGAKRGFGTLIQLLDEAEEGLSKFGDMLYEIGKKASNWVADKFQDVVDKITDITESFEFQSADLKGKISMLWNGVIVDPLKEWWESGGRKKTEETAGKIGSWIGKTLSKGLLALFGATDVLNKEVGENAGSSIAGSFLQGFLDNFDGKAITNAFVDAIGNIWGAIPGWAKLLIGGYGIGRAAGGIANLAGGVLNFIGGAKNVLGSFSIASSAFPILTSSGSGILGLLGKAGVGLGASTVGSALLMGGGGIAGGIAGGASLIKGGIDLYRGYTTEDEVEALASKTSGWSAVGGVGAGAAAGAAIGSVVPVIGTALGALLGAGIGGIAGWIGGDARADKIRAAKYESEEMQEAVKDSKKSAEELAQVLAKAKWKSAKEHFGDIELSMTEIARLANQIVWGDDIAYYEQFATSVQAAEASLQSMKTASQQASRWMWKAGLGVTFNEDEVESILQSFDDYISSAQSYVDNKHYEVAAAVSLMVDVESEEGKAILESGNTFYGKIKEDLAVAGEELGNLLTEALADGFINADEQGAIIAAQQKIASITEKIAGAELDAELDLIKIKFGSGNLDYESFENFMAQMQTTIDERMTASDEAFVASVSSLRLQLAEGAITQEQYDSMFQSIVDGYTATVEGLQANVREVELNIIGEAYADVLGADAVADLNNALQYAIDNGLDPITISDETIAGLLNIEVDGNGVAIDNFRDMLSGVLSHLKLLEVDGNLMVKIGEVQTDGDIEEIIAATVPEPVVVDVTCEARAQNSIEILKEEFGIDDTYAAQIVWLLNGKKSVQEQVTVLATEFGILPSMAENILWKLTGSKDILTKFSLSASEFGILSTYSYSPIVNVTPRLGSVGSVSVPSLISQDGEGYRGGIFGGDSAMDAFARGGSTDNGGIVGGSTRFIRVNEESPEMIIPLSSQRRERALDLWTKTGEMLGVPGFARGGETGGSHDEGIRFQRYGENDAPSGQTVQVDVGGIQIEINVNGDDKAGIAEAIRAQVGDIADYVVGRIADELAGQFENTPVRGGAA